MQEFYSLYELFSKKLLKNANFIVVKTVDILKNMI